MSVIVAAFEVADPVGTWTRAGFSVDSGAVCRIGGVDIRLVGRDRGHGLIGWSLSGLPPDSAPGSAPDDAPYDVDGIPTTWSHPATAAAATHRNGAVAIDHVVLLSPDLDRTVTALAGIDVHPRRERDGELGGRPMRQIFFRLGEVIVEVVGSPQITGAGPSTLWGLTYVVADIGETAAFYGDRITGVKDAVQPGRRITTLRHDDVGMSVRTAFLSAPILGA